MKYAGELIKKGDGGEIPVWISKRDLGSLPKNSGDSKIYKWLKDSRSFFGVIRHKGRALDENETFVDYF